MVILIDCNASSNSISWPTPDAIPGLDHPLNQEICGKSQWWTIARIPQSAQDVSVAIVVLVERHQHFVIDLRYPNKTAAAAGANCGHAAPRLEIRQRRNLHLHASFSQRIEIVGD